MRQVPRSRIVRTPLLVVAVLTVSSCIPAPTPPVSTTTTTTTTTITTSTTTVPDLPGVVDVASGRFHSCALLDDGLVRCWGDNHRGQLGDGTQDESLNPVTVLGIGDAVGVGVGAEHSCALRSDGTVVCWGDNTYGQLGLDSISMSATPTPMDGVSGVTSLEVGLAHACAVLPAGSVWCWGHNGHGQVGIGMISDWSAPVIVPGIQDAEAMALGMAHACALTGSGVSCWGLNHEGQLGTAPSDDELIRPSPVTADEIVGAVALALGTEHTCAVLLDRTVRCWGATNSPVVAGLTDVVAISAALNRTCASYGESASVVCWLFRPSSDLEPVPGLSGVTALSTGFDHVCAAIDRREVRCWGDNSRGQLGDGTTDSSTSPVTVLGLVP